MPSKRTVDRLRKTVRFVERRGWTQPQRRERQWPKGSGGSSTKVYRLTTRATHGLSATGIRQRPGSTLSGWEDANATVVTLAKNFSYGWHFTDEIVEVKKIGSDWEIVSQGSPQLRAVLDATLTSGGSADASVYSDAWVTDSGDNITVPPWSGTMDDSIPSGTRVLLGEVGGGWAVTGREC